MSVNCYAAVSLEEPRDLCVERVTLADLGRRDVVVKVGAAGIGHADLEVITVSLRVPLPVGREAVGVIERAGPEARGGADGDPVVLSWNPHCGDCFYSDRSLPILCEEYLDWASKGGAFDRRAKAALADGRDLHQLMFLGASAEYCVVADQQAIRVPQESPFERATLIGRGVMAGAETTIAADLEDRRLDMAAAMGASKRINVRTTDLAEEVRAATGERGSGGRRPFRRLPEGRRGGPSRPRGDLARKARRQQQCGLPLGRADAGKAYPARKLWRGAAAARLSLSRPRLFGRTSKFRRFDHRPDFAGRAQCRLSRLGRRLRGPIRNRASGVAS